MSLPKIDEEVLTRGDKSIAEISETLCEDLLTSKYDIVVLMESLEFALTSKSVYLRACGVKLLSLILGQISNDFLTTPQLEFIGAFYCDRVKDNQEVLAAVLEGFIAIFKMTAVPENLGNTFVRTFQCHINCQSQSRQDREKIFIILQSLVETGRLDNHDLDVLYTVINMIDGERDPRNLSLIFSFMPRALRKCELKHLAEDVFETFACYFPIDFTPAHNQDEPFITREDLANKLANCLTGSNDFIQWTMDLAFEKFESDLVVAKLDSLELMRKCSENLDTEKIHQYGEQIWNLVRMEIFMKTPTKNLKEACVENLKTFLNRCAESSHELIAEILKHILPHLSDPGHLMFTSAKYISIALVTSEVFFELAFSKLCTALLLSLQHDDFKEHKPELIDTFYEISTKSLMSKNKIPAYLDFVNHLVNSLKDPTNSAELNNLILKCIAFELIPEQKPFYDFLTQCVLQNRNDIDFSRPFAILEINELKINFIDPFVQNYDTYTNEIKSCILSKFIAIMKIKGRQDYIINLMKLKLFHTADADDKILVIGALKQLLLGSIQKEFICELHHIHHIIENLIELCHNSTFDFEVLKDISIILNLFVRNINENDKIELLNKYFSNIELTSVTNLIVMKGLFECIYTSSIDESMYIKNLFKSLKYVLNTNDNKSERELCYHMMCMLLNYLGTNAYGKIELEELLDTIAKQAKREKTNVSAETFAWLSKGLIVKGYYVENMITQVIDILNDEQCSDNGVYIFKIISTHNAELTIRNKNFLYEQKFFHLIHQRFSDKLIEHLPQYIDAFIYVLRITPFNVINLYSEKVCPILLKALQSTQVDTDSISLELIKNFVQNKNEYMGSLVPQLIAELNRVLRGNKPMEIRVLAVQILELLKHFPSNIIFRHKNDVLLALRFALDDKKRLVRNAAVRARNIWFLIDSVE